MSETKKILFRCDQNEFSGFGHFSRCLNLARHFAIGNKFKVSFLGNYSDFAIELLNKYEISYKNIEEKKFEKFETEIFSQHNYVLFDSYFIDQDYIWWRKLDESVKGFVDMKDPTSYEYLADQKMVKHMGEVLDNIQLQDLAVRY